ncbi:MAG: ABC transporter permease subunit [Candidatus Bathyarchaeia archaeon]
MDRAWIIARKEIKEIARSRYILSSLVIPIVLIGVLVPFVTTIVPLMAAPGLGSANFPAGIERLIPGFTEMTFQQKLTYFETYFVLAPLLLMVPLMTPIYIAADSFAGERERKTVEPLLATPISDLELFFGKLLTSFIPSMAVSLVTFASAAAILAVAALDAFGRVIFPNLAYVGVMVLTTPLATVFSIGVMVVMSARIANVRDASQIGGIVVLPVILLLFGQLFNLFLINEAIVLAASLLIGLTDALLIRIATSRFDRENLLTKL